MAEPAINFPAIRFADVGVTFANSAPAAQGFSLDIAPGTFLTLLGHPGAGGRELLMALAGLAPVRQGQILLHGRPIGRTPPAKRNLGLVVAGGALFPHLNVADNIAFPLRARGLNRAERDKRLGGILARLNLGDIARDPVHTGLAPAQVLTVALARALVAEPAALLLDDPAEGLDEASRQAWEDTLRRLRGQTTLMVTRDGNRAMAVSDLICAHIGGTVLQTAPPATLYDRPTHRLVPALLGPVNILDGQITALADGTAEIRLRGGPLVRAHPVDPLRINDRCLFIIRPARIAVAAMEAARMGENAIPAVVGEVVYQGDHARISLLIGDSLAVTVHRSSVLGLAGLVPNRPAAIAWRAEDAWAFRLPGT